MECHWHLLQKIVDEVVVDLDVGNKHCVVVVFVHGAQTGRVGNPGHYLHLHFPVGSQNETEYMNVSEGIIYEYCINLTVIIQFHFFSNNL